MSHYFCLLFFCCTWIVHSSAGKSAYARSLAIAYAKDEKMQEAQTLLDKMEYQGVSAEDCKLVRAELYALEGKYQQALRLYKEVIAISRDTQLLSHAYLNAAQLAQASQDSPTAILLLQEAISQLGRSWNILHRQMLADIYIELAVEDKEKADGYYQDAEVLLQGLIDDGVGTLQTYLKLSTVMQTSGRYEEAEEQMLWLLDQYPQDYQVDMQIAYLYISWQQIIETDKRDYQTAYNYYQSAQEKYRQAQANGKEDPNMKVLDNLVSQLKTTGWL